MSGFKRYGGEKEPVGIAQYTHNPITNPMAKNV